ncbi:isoprenylcysteine carboxylmethyltransferase family protein [Salmonella enterica subsp. enterica serovar Sandiego]|nr:isoprenylcysteine carboxylmethyltransferase family protein [Salmonella enterica subsp. enterica serovar Sandiego]
MKINKIYTRYVLSLVIPFFLLAFYRINLHWVLLVSIYSAWYIAEAIIEINLSKKQGKNFIRDDNDRYSRVFLVFVRNLILAISAWHITAFSRENNYLFLIFALALFISGLVIRIHAILSLGQQFTMVVNINDDYVLVEEGIYSLIRHPAYCGLLMIYTSFSMISGSLVLIITSLFLTLLAIINRIKIEEHLLTLFFKEKYKNYIKKTWAILPYIY